MPPRQSTTAPPVRRQLSIETAATPSDEAELDSDIDDSGFDPVQVAAELKKAIDGHKKRRFAARKKIERTYEVKLDEIVRRTEKRLAEREALLARKRPEQMARLVAAVEARDAKQRAVADKVARFYDSCATLTSLLENVYMGLADAARGTSLELEKDAAMGV